MKINIRSVLCCALALSACSKQSAQKAEIRSAAVLSGTISLAEPATPSHLAVLELSLTDVSADDGSIEIAKTSLQPPRYPAKFALTYDSAAIDPRHRYTVSARLLEGMQPQWITDTAYPVITLGNPLQVDLQLVRSGANTQSTRPASDTPPTFSGELRTSAGIISYDAYFQNAQLARIEAQQNKEHASYEYLGARLQHFAARDPAAETSMELRFDEQGKLAEAKQLSRGQVVTVNPQAIDSVRNRAALLRSHALATREIKEHDPQAGPQQPAGR